jgi:hypothetical protein
MIKKIFLALLGLAVIGIIVIALFGSKMLNSGIKKGVETIGPRVTQTNVTLEAVDISIFSGAGKLTGLNVGNPEGFKSENIFALGEIDVAVQISSLLSDKIIIDRVIIKNPAISYETRISTSNVKQLLENIEAFTGPKAEEVPAEEVPADSVPGKQVVIRKVIVEGATVYVGLLGVGQAVPLPRIELNDIGEDRKMNIADAIDLVLTEVLKAIGPAISNAGGMLKDSGKALLDGAISGDDSAAKKATDGIKNLFGK